MVGKSYTFGHNEYKFGHGMSAIVDARKSLAGVQVVRGALAVRLEARGLLADHDLEGSGAVHEPRVHGHRVGALG